MRKINYLLVFALMALMSVCKAQSVGAVQGNFRQEGNAFYFTTTRGVVKLDFCTDAMFRVLASWNGRPANNEPWMVVQYNWAPVKVKTSSFKDHFLLQTATLDITVARSPFRILVYTKDGALLSADKQEAAGSLFKKGDTVGCRKQIQPDEHFFGFGERMDFMDRRSKKLRLNVGRGTGRPHIIGAYNILEANYCPVPFFMSTKGYGIFFHNSFATDWDMGASDEQQISFQAAGGVLDYYFIYGPRFPAILRLYTALTGRSPLMPLFALGLHLGTYSGGTWGHEAQTSDRYVIELARKMRELGIPVDLLWLDSTWRIFGGKGGTGATSFEWRPTFEDPKGMFDSVYALHYKMVGLHLRPRFDNGHHIRLLDTAQQLGYTYPEKNSPGEFVNFFDSNAVNWWWQHGVMRVASIGARFLKTDEGSAFAALANESNKTGPSGKEAQRLHNLFPIAYAKAPYEKFQQYNGIRGMNQTREGYAGIQRYPFIFAGDWPSEWQYFAPVIKAGLNIGISGVGDWAHCMGGFERPADPELYIRWCQFGMFSSVALVFGMDHPGYKEPWNYGEAALLNFKKYDSLRYRLIPYLYTQQYHQYKTGLPIMRALVLEYQDDPNVYTIGDQYMLGDALMVCPVTTKGAQTRVVYLPAGDWTDYWTGRKYTGKQYYNIVSPLDRLPLFVKAGAIIPMQPAMNYIGEKPVDLITLDIYPAAHAQTELYEDDGQSLQYRRGQYAVTNISVSLSGKSMQLRIEKPQGAFKPAAHRYLAQIHISEAPAAVRENGKVVSQEADVEAASRGWYYDRENKILWVKTAGNNSDTITISIDR